jgi:hypothetical protein
VLKSTKEITMNPRRLIWVGFDGEVFLKLLTRLTGLNDYLHNLLHGHEARLFEEASRKTQLDMVLIKNSVENLEHLVAAALLLSERRGNPISKNALRENNDHLLASLARSKQLKLAADESPKDEKPPDYTSTMKSTVLKSTQVTKTESSGSDSQQVGKLRIVAKYKPGDHPVWIEWRPYRREYSEESKRWVPRDANLKRVQQLVSLLQSNKPEEFCVPECLGYFDVRDETVIFQINSDWSSNCAGLRTRMLRHQPLRHLFSDSFKVTYLP